LHKYLTGERKLNPEIVLKLSAFSNTKPEHWYRIQVKNELLEMKKEKRKIADYQKYSYRNII
jgi:plasmid maintenance system antidote protein VapI